MHALLFFLLALSVKQDQAPLRAGCDRDTTVLADLPAGTPLELRYVMAGDETPCYKVKANFKGRSLEGYLFPQAMDGLEDFDKGRKQAAAVGLDEALAVVRNSQERAALARPDGVRATGPGVPRVLIAQAQDLIEANHPGKALELLEPELKKHDDPGLLALAGVAAWRADDAPQALELWHKSLAEAPNPQLEKLIARVQREQANDESGEKLFGVRVVLRYQPSLVPVETARQMLTVVDATYARVSSELGCATDERIATIVQSREAYMKATNAAEWSGAIFDGRIHMPAENGQTMTSEAVRTLAHETTHACLSLLGQWPAWLQEGMAQKLSGDKLTKETRARLAALAGDGKLPKLENLKNDWSSLDTDHARLAYALALAAVEVFYENNGSDAIRNLMRNPERIGSVSPELDKYLGLNN